MTVPLYANISGCRSCGSTELLTFLQLGDLPLSGHLLRADQLDAVEPRYPMDIAFCARCSLVQLLYTVAPQEVFATDYPYFSSVSPTWVEHCRQNADDLMARFGLLADNRVVEIASNDGYLLQHFHGVQVLGIDPAEGPAQVAINKGIPTEVAFFTKQLADRLVSESRQADVVIGNNVLAHVAELNDFVAGVATLLTDQGTAVFEVPHVLQLVDRCEFDTMYHEHLCYYSLTALATLFARHGLTLYDVIPLSTHGGSLRVFARKGAVDREPLLDALLDHERDRGVPTLDYYQDFAARVKLVQEALVAFLGIQQYANRRIVAYGAAAKGGTLLNSCGITTDLIEYVVDKSPAKQGRYMTGSRLPVFAPEKLLEDQPDFAVLLTWNFKDEILLQQAEYRRRGGKFVLPIPNLEVV